MADRKEFEIGGKLLSTLRVVDLKLELEKRGLSKSGSKKELADRLKVQLRLEKLQEDASTDEGHVPNLRLQDDEIADNDLIKDYLAKQQQTYEMQKEARRRVELEEQRVRDSSEASAEETSQGEEESELNASAVTTQEEQIKVPELPVDATSVVEEETTETNTLESSKNLSAENVEIRLSGEAVESNNNETSTADSEEISKSGDSRQQKSPESSTDTQKQLPADEQTVSKDLKLDDQPVTLPSVEPSRELQTSEEAKIEEKTDQESLVSEAVPASTKEEDSVKVEKEAPKEESNSHNSEQSLTIDHGSSPDGDREIDTNNKKVEMKDHTKEAGDVERARSRSPSRDSVGSESRGRRSRRSSSSSRSSSNSRSRSSDSRSSDSRSRSRKRSESKRSESYHGVEPVDDLASQSSPRQELEVKADAEEDKMMEVEESSSTVDEVSNRENKVSGKSDDGKPIPEVGTKVSSRKISLSSLKDSQTSEEGKENHETTEFPVPRKRKWGNSGATAVVIGKKASLSISTDSLKGLIPELKPLSSISTSLSDSSAQIPENSDTRPTTVSKPTTPAPTTKRELIVFRSNSQPEKEATEKSEPPVKVLRPPVRRISTPVNSDAPATKVTPTPARHPPSRIIHIRNLVRPFTLGQLKELLSKTGTLVEGGFWIDKIKSKCYVTYETEEQAVSTRQALHETQWPSSNPKILSVDFATQDELEFHRSLAETTELKKAPNVVENKIPVEAPIRPKALSPRARGAKLSVEEEKTPEKPRRDSHKTSDRENKEKERGGVGEKDKRSDRGRNQQLTELNNNNSERDRTSSGARRDRDDQRFRGKDKSKQPPVREWDRDKIGERSPGERERARVAHGRNRSRSRSRSRGARSPLGRRDRNRDAENRDRNDRRREEEAPAKLLDDLFRKTKTTPCIYWLPLTVEQIHMKEEQRKQRQVEREKRRQQNDQINDNVKRTTRSRSRDKEENRNWRRSKSPVKSRNRRR